MPSIYVLNTLDNKRASSESFDSKKAAKQVRNKLIAEGTVCVVSRGPDHPFGASYPERQCQNRERTSLRGLKKKHLKEAVSETLEKSVNRRKSS